MLITIDHRLKIDCGELLPRLLLHLLLTPQNGPGQRILDWSIAFAGGGHKVPLVDGFGNRASLVSLTNVAGPVEIGVSGRVETVGGNGVLGWPMGEPVAWLYMRVTPATRVPATVWGRFRAETGQRDGQLATLHALMRRIHELYAPMGENGRPEQSQVQDGGEATQSQSQGATPPRTARDYAETFVGAARALGVPARFVSGYLVPDEAAEAGGTHQWAEACVEGLGWIGFDAMLDLCPTDRHVRMAVGLDALTAAPMRAYPPLDPFALPVETVTIGLADGSGQ